MLSPVQRRGRLWLLCSRSVLLAYAASCLFARAQNAVIFVPGISTGAGNGTAGYMGDTGAATAAELSAPGNVAYDASGNLYIADTTNNVIRKVTTSGIITTVAGTAGAAGFSGDGGAATSAQLSAPNGIAFDSAGNLYIADTGNARIREVVSGTINTIAGNGTKAVYTADGPALTSPLDGPNSIALDSSGNVYIADSTSNRCLEYVKSSAQLVLFAGASNAGGTPSGDNGQAKLAKFSGPRAVATDNAGNVYLVDKTHAEIRKVNSSGIITTVAGNATTGFMGDGGLATAAELSGPVGVFVDTSGNLYIVDAGNQRIREVSATTLDISTIAGNGTAGDMGDGGAPTAAELNNPAGVAVSTTSGQIAIADTTNNVIRVISGLVGSFPSTSVTAKSAPQTISAEVVTQTTLQSYQLNPSAPADFTLGAVSGCTLPGAQTAGTTCSAPVTFNPTVPGLRISQVIATDNSSNQYVYAVFGIGNAPAIGLGPGTETSYAGTGTAGSTGDSGAASAALLNGPLGVALDVAGNLYIADTVNNKIRKVSSGGTITTAAGNGTASFSGDSGAATAATLNLPSGVALDPSGNVYIADKANDVIREISVLNGTISTFAGTGGTAGYKGDSGAATSATLNSPKSVAADTLGNVYIADTGNNVIRAVNNGTINTVSTGTTTLSAPAGVAVDAAGDLFIADTGNNVIRELSNGTLTTFAGTSGVTGFAGDGSPATSARLSAPTQVAVDAAGNVYIADSGNQRIRFVSAQSGLISTVAGTGTAGSTGNGGGATSALLSTPSGITVDQAGRFYIADTANNRIQKVDDTTVSLTFGQVNVNTTSTAQTAVITNIGNQSSTTTKLTVPTGFAQVASGGTDCTATTTLASGAACLISIVFKPIAKQGYTGSVILTDNALNFAGTTQNFSVSGSGTIPSTPTSINIVAGNNQTANPLAPFGTQLKVTVTDQNSTPVSNISVVFTAPATGASGTFAGATNTVTVTTDASGNATAPVFTANGTRGIFSITAAVAVIATPATFTETISGNPSPVITVSIQPMTNPVTYGQTVQLTATLSPATFNGSAPMGSVTFLDGGLAIGSGTLSNASATLPNYLPSATFATPHTFTASYSTDGNFASSTNSNTVTLTVNKLNITATANSVSTVYSPGAPPVPSVSLTGTLNGVLPADQSQVTATFTSTSFSYGSINGTTGIIGTAAVGGYPITAALASNATANNYNLTSTSGQVTITQAGTTTLVTSSTLAPAYGSSVTLKATVTPTTNGTPTKTVYFYSGTQLLGSMNLSAGVASLPTSALPLGNDSVYAVYGGDTNFTGSTSPTITLADAVPAFTLTATPASATLAQGDTASITLNVTTVGSYTGTITPTCTGLPANAACIFVPASLATSANRYQCERPATDCDFRAQYRDWRRRNAAIQTVLGKRNYGRSRLAVPAVRRTAAMASARSAPDNEPVCRLDRLY